MPLVNRTFDQLIDFTRTSAATFVNSSGNIASTAQSRNLLTFTQEFSNAAWTKTNASAYPFDPATASLSANVVQNGDFSSGASWSLSATAPATATIASGKLTLVSPAGEAAVANQAALKVGSWYKVTGTVTVRSGTVKVICGGPTEFYFSATQTFTIYTQANSNTTLSLSRQTACDADFDDIVVQEVTVGISAPDGTFTADTMVATAGAGISPLLIQTGTTVTSSVYTASLFVRPGTHTFVQFYIGSQSADWCNFTLTGNGSVQNNGAAVGAISYNSATGWYRISMVYTAGGIDRRAGLAIVPSGTASRVQTGTYAGTETIFIWGAQLEAVPDANLVLGSELRGSGVVSTTGSPSPLATYNTATGEATLNRVDGSNVSGVRIPVGGAGRAIRVSVTITATTGTVQVRGNGVAGTILNTVGAAAGTYLLYVVSDTSDIYLTMSSNATTASITINSVREITGTVGMPSDYTRNFGGLFPPRFDYDPVTLQPRGLLIEEQRTNLLLRSEEFDNAAWTKTAVTATANATTSPDGTADADSIIETTDNSTHDVNQSATLSAVAYTYSAFVKANGRSWVRLFVFQSGPGSTSVWFNVSTGVVGTVGAGASNATITNFGNGWYRCAFTFTAIAASANLYAQLATADNGASTYTGDGTSGIFIYGAQLEAGAFATSYIPTVAAQVTRTADTATINAPNFASWYNQTAGSFVVEFQTLQSGTLSQTIYALALDTNGSKRIVYIANGGDVASTFDGTTIISASDRDVTGTVSKTASAYDGSGRAIVSNGGTVATGAVVAGYSTATSLNIGSLGGGQSFGWLRSIRYYPTRLTNAQLQALTA